MTIYQNGNIGYAVCLGLGPWLLDPDAQRVLLDKLCKLAAGGGAAGRGVGDTDDGHSNQTVCSYKGRVIYLNLIRTLQSDSLLIQRGREMYI